jgi:hypothetical protein
MKGEIIDTQAGRAEGMEDHARATLEGQAFGTLSKQALLTWATDAGFKLVFLDAASGNPRTGIADALLLPIRPKAADQIELYVVQLKGGGSGFKPKEMARLDQAAAAVKAIPLIVLHDGERLHFLGGSPSFTVSRSRTKTA